MNRFALIILTVIASLLTLSGLIMVGTYYSTTDTVTCTVTDKDRTTNRESGSDMRVYTSDCGVLKVADSILDGHWSSADVFSEIEPGGTYTFKTRGYRMPLVTAFPNIVEVVE